jgi:uncharacterized membrane protein YhiD involved in acid resistance
MQLQQSFTEMFGNPTTLGSIPGLIVNLCLAAILGVLLGLAYARFGQSLSNRRLFARNFLLLTVTTTLIISIVKSSLALSLGLVGALSIVRFRAAIKEPEELAFLFLAIGIGLGLGAGQALVTIVALAVILGLVAIRSLVQQAPPQPNLYVTVSSPGAGKLSAGQILEALTASGARASLRRLDESPEQLEASFLVDFCEVAKLEQFTGRLRQLCQEVKVSCLEDRGLVA